MQQVTERLGNGQQTQFTATAGECPTAPNVGTMLLFPGIQRAFLAVAGRTVLTLASHVRRNVRYLLYRFVGKFGTARNRVVLYSCGPARHGIR